MVVNKTYNIEQLAEVLQQKVEESKKYNEVVKLNILTANDILEVLQETNRMEQRNQTLESALVFIEKEDGTHTNLMEEHNKKPECFGQYKKNDNWEVCEECPYEIRCHMEEYNKEHNKKIECFGMYYTNCKQCDNIDCDVRTDCIFETKLREEAEE